MPRWIAFPTMSDEPDPPTVLTVDQAAELLQVSITQVRRLAKAGTIPARRMGGYWRFSREALLAWIAEGDAQPQPRRGTGPAKPAPPDRV